jgi:hypothetical protein
MEIIQKLGGEKELVRISRTKSWFNKHKEKIEIIVAITTILSLVFAVSSYWYSVYRQELNNRIILENLQIEIDYNLEIISFFNENYLKMKEEDSGLVNQLDSYFLEKSQEIIKDKEIREDIIIVISEIYLTNKYMDDFNMVKVSNLEEYISFQELHNEMIDTIYTDDYHLIKEKLTNLKAYLNQTLK